MATGFGCWYDTKAEKLKSVRGQASVELAVLMPVVLVVTLVSYNLARFVALCATFDRVSLDAVVSQGVAPAGTQTKLIAAESVRDCIESALDAPQTCSVEVAAESVRDSARGRRLSVSPLLTRFRCSLVFRPWPSSFSIAGVSCQTPFALRHERSLVVDRYRPGVVM